MTRADWSNTSRPSAANNQWCVVIKQVRAGSCQYHATAAEPPAAQQSKAVAFSQTRIGNRLVLRRQSLKILGPVCDMRNNREQGIGPRIADRAFLAGLSLPGCSRSGTCSA